MVRGVSYGDSMSTTLVPIDQTVLLYRGRLGTSPSRLSSVPSPLLSENV